MSSTFYIPPPGLLFRLIGYVSQHAIYSRDAHDIGLYSVSNGEQSDQWFTLLHDSQGHPGRYAIKGLTSGRVLFSRSQPPRVGHIEGDGRHEDNWFKIEPGPGLYTNYFRLITREGGALYSCSSPNPTFSNYDEKKFYPDQLFGFVWEDMRVDNVEFNLEAGKIVSSRPVTLTELTLRNDLGVGQEMSFSVDKSVTNSSTFEYGAGFTVNVGMEFRACIPSVAPGKKLGVGVSNSHTWTWGETTHYDTQYTATLPLKAGSERSVRASSLVTQSMVEVPFTMYMSSKRTPRVKVQTTGTWHGICSWDHRLITKDVKHSI